MSEIRVPIITLLVLFLATAPGQAASFDCAKAATRAEKTRCADPGQTRDKNPPEVDALIGIRISPVVVNVDILERGESGGHRLRPTLRKQLGPIPGWDAIGGASLNDDWVSVPQIYSAHHSAIAVVRRDKDLDRLILDAQVLPSKLLTYELINKTTRLRKHWHRYYSVGSYCARSDGEVVVGLMRPETGKHNCIHYSHQVIKAWQVNLKDGQLKEISPTGVVCHYFDAEDDCSN